MPLDSSKLEILKNLGSTVSTGAMVGLSGAFRVHYFNGKTKPLSSPFQGAKDKDKDKDMDTEIYYYVFARTHFYIFLDFKIALASLKLITIPRESTTRSALRRFLSARPGSRFCCSRLRPSASAARRGWILR